MERRENIINHLKRLGYDVDRIVRKINELIVSSF